MSEITDGLVRDGWRLIDRDGAWIGNVEQLCAGERGDGLAVAAPLRWQSTVTTSPRR